MSHLKTLSKGVIGGIFLLLIFWSDISLLIWSKKSLSFLYVLLIFPIIALSGSFFVFKKPKLAGKIIISGTWLTIISLFILMRIYDYGSIPGPVIYFFAISLLFISGLDSSKLKQYKKELQRKIGKSKKFKEISELAHTGGIITLVLSSILFFFTYMSITMSREGYFSSSTLFRIYLMGGVSIIAPILSIIYSKKININPKKAGIIILISGIITLWASSFINIASIVLIIAGIQCLRLLENSKS
jgi:hypothetical protein